MKPVEIRSDELLSALLPELDLRCGGQGTCGRCRVRLLTGRWQVDDVFVDAPAEALACRTRLAGESGTVVIPPENSLRTVGQGALAWSGAPLPATDETVLGIDLGTTTVAAVRIRGGRVLGEAIAFNRQSRFGDNVIARINHASRSAAQVAELQRSAVETINALLDEIGGADAVRIGLAGNTVMSCLLHGIDPTPIGVLPFTPPCRSFPVRPAAELGIRSGTLLYTVPAVSGFIGGDLTGGLAETALRPGEMLIDIGTNCEIMFHTADGIFCTAAAAGPAFEGAGVSCGCRAVRGAIDRYYGAGDFSVLGGGDPVGLCGSAMIDFLAVERRAGRLNEFGRLRPPAPAFALAPGVSVTEADIEQLLKAKAAVAAGIRTLEAHCGVRAARIHLAGGFARYLDLANAVAIGMLPEREYRIVGNSSLAAAARLAVRPAYLAEMEERSCRPVEIPLNTLPDFEDNYIDGLLLP